MDTKTSSPGERENVGAQPPCVSFDRTTLVLGCGDHVGCVVKDNKLQVFKAVYANNLIGFTYAQNQMGLWGADHGIPCNRAAADVGMLAAYRMQHGAWKVFDPKVSALLPSVDSFLED